MATHALRGCGPHTPPGPVARFPALDFPILLKAPAAPVVERIHGDVPTPPGALKPLPPQDPPHCGSTDQPEVGPRPKSEVFQGTQQAPSSQPPADPSSPGGETADGRGPRAALSSVRFSWLPAQVGSPSRQGDPGSARLAGSLAARGPRASRGRVCGVPPNLTKSFVVGGSNPQTGDHGVRGREVTRPRACPTPGSRLFCSFGRCGSGQSAHGHVHRTCARCQAQCQHRPHQDAPGHKAGSATHGPRAVRRLPQGHTDGGVEPGSQSWPV